MPGPTLQPLPLTNERFLPYGEVIETVQNAAVSMNEARFDLFDRLCNVDVGDGDVSVGIVCSRTPTSLPYVVNLLERHPLGSQAFVPLSPCRMVIVVAPPGEAPDLTALKAFETNGRQGINYAPGTWHMPLISFESGQRYLFIQRAGSEPNCDEFVLDEPILLEDDRT